MNWADEPATEYQLSHLRQFGYEPEHPLTKGEASHLLSDFEAHPEREAGLAESHVREMTKHEVYRLRVAVEDAKRAVAKAEKDEIENSQRDLVLAVAKRQEFWMDTCRDPGKMRAASVHVLDLYMKYGCRFVAPRHEQVQEILDAFDSAMPLWDRDHPELFYQTLELNFPELLRQRPTVEGR